MLAQPLANALAQPLARSLVFDRGGGIAIITGFAYPQETLTSSRAGQWTVDGVPVVGQTGSTYTVRLQDIGFNIACANSAPVRCWAPWDEAGIVSVRTAHFRYFGAINPDVLTTDGQGVRRWQGLVSAQNADQAVGANQPIWRATGQSGNPSLEFDGVNDFLSLSGSELDTFRNVGTGYIFVGCRDVAPNGGQSNHIPAGYEVGGLSAGRLGILTRTTGNVFGFYANRNDDTSALILNAGANNSNYNVLTAEALFSSGIFNGRINGAQVATGGFGSSGLTPNTRSFTASIGATLFGATPLNQFPGHITCVITGNQLLTAAARARIERFIGLYGNLNIPLV